MSPNLLENPTLAPGVSKAPAGWQLPAGVRDGGIDGVQVTGDTTRLQVLRGVSPTLRQRVAVEPNQDYWVSLEVRSPDRLVLQIGPVRAAYHRQGDWQQVIALVNSNADRELEVVLQLGALASEPAEYELRGLQMRPVTAPGLLAPRPRFERTALVEAGQARALIVANDTPAMQQLARHVQVAIAERTGVSLPIRTDRQVTEEESPRLRDSAAQEHLILIGRLGTNRALWTAYNRFLAAADGYYPGGDGYVVRTASNVLRNGRNHLILGGSSDDGVVRAVERFVAEHVPALELQGSAWQMPWLLDVQLGGDCLAAFDQADALWSDDPTSTQLPPIEPGYGTVRRWYENAMGYYWSGRASYRERALRLIEPVLADRAYTHHYIVEFMVRAFDMLDDSPLLSDAQRAGMDELFQHNFWTMASGPDRVWMTTFSPPYETVQLVNRHQIAPWAADWKLAEFLGDYVTHGDAPDDLAALVAFRRSEKEAFFDHLVDHRWGVSAPGAASTSHVEEIAAFLARYALDRDRYGFFASGHAQRGLFLERINHRTGQMVRPAGMVDHALILGLLAHYHQDGRYRALLDVLPQPVHPMGHFQGRYVAGVHRWVPGEEIALQSPESLAGVQAPPMMPQFEAGLRQFHRGSYEVTPAMMRQPLLDFASFRGGFGPDDDYFAIGGLPETTVAPGAIIHFSSRGVSWLGGGVSDDFSPSSGNYFDQNAVHVLPVDRWLPPSVRYPALARQDWQTGSVHRGGLSLTLAPFMGMDWQRQVVWVDSGLFLVRDRLAAREAGRYQVAVNWRPAGLLDWDGQVLTARSGASVLRLTPLSTDLAVRENLASFRAGEEEQMRFYLGGAADCAQGAALQAISVLQALRPAQEGARTARLIDRDTVLVAGPGEEADAALLIHFGGHGGAPWGAIQSDAQVLVIAADRFEVMQATRLSLGGQVLLDAAQPVSFAVDFTRRTLRWEASQASLAQAPALQLPGWRIVAAEAQAATPWAIEPAAGTAAPLQSQLAALIADQATGTATWANRAEAAPAGPVIEPASPSAAQEVWRYDGLLRAGRVSGVRQLAGGVWDLGRAVQLEEVRAVHVRGPYRPSPLPDSIAVVPAGALPAADSPAWRTVSLDRAWQPLVRTGNYGQAVPDPEVFQRAMLPETLPAVRYVRAAEGANLVFYDRADRRARRPLELQIADVDRDGEPEVLVRPVIWPKFLRPRQVEDDAMALLGADGRPRFERQARTNYQAVELLEAMGDGHRQVALLEVDAQLELLDAQGQVQRRADLWAMHQHFDATEGRPNTRQPAGGFTMPYSVGAWRRDASGRAGLVIGRYGALSFLDGADRFEGVLHTGGYVVPAMLPQGLELDGQAPQTMVGLARGSVLVIGGEPAPRVTDPQGLLFYPQVYDAQRPREPAWDPKIDGAQVLCFEALPWAGKPGLVLAVRENYLGLFDAKAQQWAFTWTPLVRIEAATVLARTERTLQIAVATGDGLLWLLRWEGELKQLASFEVVTLPVRARGLAGFMSADGRLQVLLATRAGLLALEAETPGAFRNLAPGAFQAVRTHPDKPGVIWAVTDRGEVVQLEAGS